MRNRYLRSLFMDYNGYRNGRYILLEYENTNVEIYKELYTYSISNSFEWGSDLLDYGLKAIIEEIINSFRRDNDLFFPGTLLLKIINVGGNKIITSNKIITIGYMVDLRIDEYKDLEYLEYLSQSLSILINVYIKPNLISKIVEKQ